MKMILVTNRKIYQIEKFNENDTGIKYENDTGNKILQTKNDTGIKNIDAPFLCSLLPGRRGKNQTSRTWFGLVSVQSPK
jgi:hypothetical protein